MTDIEDDGFVTHAPEISTKVDRHAPSSSLPKLVELKPRINSDAVSKVEHALEQLRSGKAVAAALVLVNADHSVSTCYSDSDVYHRLNSGAARLAYRLASLEDDAP